MSLGVLRKNYKTVNNQFRYYLTTALFLWRESLVNLPCKDTPNPQNFLAAYRRQVPQNLKFLKSIYPKPRKCSCRLSAAISKSPKTTTSRINLDKKIYFSHMQGLTLTSDIPDGVQVFCNLFFNFGTIQNHRRLWNVPN